MRLHLTSEMVGLNPFRLNLLAAHTEPTFCSAPRARLGRYFLAPRDHGAPAPLPTLVGLLGHGLEKAIPSFSK